jgi:hypothetical protein
VKFLDVITLFLATACRAGSAAFLSVVAKTVRKMCLMVGLLVVGLALLLGAMGLMIAALFIGLTPYLGAHWAAMIAAGASLAGSCIFLVIAPKVFKGR